MPSPRNEIITGIEDELLSSDEKVVYPVRRRVRDGDLWVLTLDVAASDRRAKAAFDDSLEGATAWWPEKPPGSADVLCLEAGNDRIVLRYATRQPPGEGEKLWIYLPQYLEALRDVWSLGSWGEQCIEWLENIPRFNEFDGSRVLDPDPFPLLRKMQRKAFELPGWPVGYLDGPPGTGKTTTLGTMLAAYLVENPRDRVLLLSTTNVAVDEALVSADRGLETLARSDGRAEAARRRCFRVGGHFVARKYEGHEHLIPAPSDELVKRKQRLESERPPTDDLHAYADWKKAVETVNAEIKTFMAGILDRAHLAAMTATRAAFVFKELRKRSPFDLIVFDEASQVSRAYALALAPLGRRCLFAGDPRQLAPIVKSDHPDALTWLGTSMFKHDRIEPRASCLLVEQSRMAEPICRVVSGAFYDGKLVVAEVDRADPGWHAERRLASVPPMGDASVYIHPIAEEGIWSQNYGGNIRQPSAVAIAEMVKALTADLDQSDILVLTPFRAQRALLRQKLSGRGLRGVSVSTVHRAQGSERHTVIFDPVKGDCDFLGTEDAGRLMNVAISRAKARLVLTLSAGDRCNRHLSRVLRVLESGASTSPVVALEAVLFDDGFPGAFVGMRARRGDVVGLIAASSESGDVFEFVESESGRRRKLSTEHVRSAALVALKETGLDAEFEEDEDVDEDFGGFDGQDD